MLKRYHEAPLCIFDEIQERTDGDYALVHLFETNPEYLAKFKKAVAKGRDVILDNSLFELGEAFDANKFIDWILYLKPRYYIVPDSWRNSEETIDMFFKFINKFKRPIEGRVGVAQGKTFEEVKASYQALEPHCEMIAFNFDFSDYYREHRTYPVGTREAMTLGRILMLTDLYNQGVINLDKKHHLLGCGIPFEISLVNRKLPWVTSMDTCHPIMTGMAGFRYNEKGFDCKCEFKMCDYMNVELNDHQKSLINHNLNVIENWEKTI